MAQIPLFKNYPLLAARLPRIELGELPTPVDELPALAGELGVGRLFVKRDDLSGRIYGGNKVRKLEFLLAGAVKAGAKEVMTFGGAGSNHALATAIYAGRLGMKSISMLVSQPNSQGVRRNLLAGRRFGAELHHVAGLPFLAASSVAQEAIHLARTGHLPQVIPPGGSSPAGVAGFVNAAFELKEQVESGVLPEPELLYCALGSCGTAAGLILGLKAAGLRTAVVPIRVTPVSMANRQRLERLVRRTGTMLKRLDPSFPRCTLGADDARIRHEFFGESYGLFTKEAVEAARLAGTMAGLKLECTYTGKAFAALISDARAGSLKARTVLFWNTYNSRDLTGYTGQIDYHSLPKSLHSYFERDVQPLDRQTLPGQLHR